MNVNLHELVKKVPAKGVLHVGANTCQELDLYKSLGIEERLWIEADQAQFYKIMAMDESCIKSIIWDKEEYLGFFWVASNNGESSSLLQPHIHLEKYPEITFKREEANIKTSTLANYNLNAYNYLVLDIQGAELRALKGLGKYLNHFDVIITEAYTEELYLGCGKLDEIKDYLTNYELVEWKPEVGKGWGDAAFIRKDLICK